jgi:tetratricopeptide (TPR) repeat protein
MIAQLLMLLLALWMPAQRWMAQVSGRVLDHEGKPLVNAQVTYTNVGQYTTGGAMANYGLQKGQVTDSTGTGRVYKTKTDKHGEFTIIGVSYGIYQVEIADPQGTRVYSGKKLVGDNTDPDVSNTLDVDLSTAPPPGMSAAGGGNLGGGKKTKEQLALVRQENANAVKLNRLIGELHDALAGQNWNEATGLLQQLLALDPNRWEFYQNLATIQSNMAQYQEAAQTYAKGVEIAEKTLVNGADAVQAKADISGMMIAEGDAYLRLNKFEDALALYSKAAALAPNPAMAYYHLCNAQADQGSAADAINACRQAIAADSTQLEFYQVLGRGQEHAGKPDAALETYAQGIELARKEIAAKPDSKLTKNVLGQILTAQGNLYASVRKYDRAIESFSESAKVSAYAALPYYNLCAMYYNISRMDEAAAACDQAISSDPAISDAYYIKAAALFGKGTLQNGKFTAPPETRDALNKYLQLAPFGSHAQIVREMLEKLDAPIAIEEKSTKRVRK